RATKTVVLSKLKRAPLPQLDLAKANLAQILLPFGQDPIDELHASSRVLEHLGIEIQFMPTLRAGAMYPHSDVIAHPGEPLMQLLRKQIALRLSQLILFVQSRLNFGSYLPSILGIEDHSIMETP